ncbi:MAG: 4'-phosphopantetheinyl transferase superfamily protein [Eubacteriales bacterium]|nr:4'-phosphopantetheinyl transferase superfamily protein [Eubacteriales bacterium]
MKAVVYYTVIEEKYLGKRLEHMIGEELLRVGVKEEWGATLAHEPRSKGEFGKPFFSLRPKNHYNISHSGKYVVCALGNQELGIDIQEHKNVNLPKLSERVLGKEEAEKLLKKPDALKLFFDQWALREAYIKWTGEGLSKDLRKIPMDQGSHKLLEIEEGYSCGIWSQDPLEITLVYKDIQLP